MLNMTFTISAVILAAGSSNRMGEPKQVLSLGSSTMLEQVIQLALHEDFEEVITVIGNEAQMIKETICVEDPRFRWIVNEDYLSGQSTSLKAGVASVHESHNNIMVFLGDTPFISPDTIQKVIYVAQQKFMESGGSFVIRPVYDGTAGHPVFFGNIDKSLFSQLQGDVGAKPIISQVTDYVQLEVTDDGILFDVDTKEQYAKAKKRIIL